MKDQIMMLLEEWKERQPPELAKPDKKMDMEKRPLATATRGFLLPYPGCPAKSQDFVGRGGATE